MIKINKYHLYTVFFLICISLYASVYSINEETLTHCGFDQFCKISENDCSYSFNSDFLKNIDNTFLYEIYKILYNKSNSKDSFLTEEKFKEKFTENDSSLAYLFESKTLWPEIIETFEKMNESNNLIKLDEFIVDSFLKKYNNPDIVSAYNNVIKNNNKPILPFLYSIDQHHKKIKNIITNNAYTPSEKKESSTNQHILYAYNTFDIENLNAYISALPEGLEAKNAFLRGDLNPLSKTLLKMIEENPEYDRKKDNELFIQEKQNLITKEVFNHESAEMKKDIEKRTDEKIEKKLTEEREKKITKIPEENNKKLNDQLIQIQKNYRNLSIMVYTTMFFSVAYVVYKNFLSASSED